MHDKPTATGAKQCLEIRSWVHCSQGVAQVSLSPLVGSYGNPLRNWTEQKPVFKVESKVIDFLLLACPMDETKLWLSPPDKKRQTVHVLGPHLCNRIWKRAMIGPLKTPLSIYQSGWKEVRNAPLAIHWYPSGAQNRISALLRRR